MRIELTRSMFEIGGNMPATKLSSKWRRLLMGIALALALLAAGTSPALAEVIFWPMEALNLAKQRALTIQCCDNLKRIGLMARSWAMDNADLCPPDFQTFLDSPASPALVFCPENIAHRASTNWAEVDFNQTDYEWLPVLPPDSWNANPSAICCRCRVYQNVAFADGSVHQLGGLRDGWPTILARPLTQDVTPGSDVLLEVEVAPDALTPLTFQWRRERLFYLTNITSLPDPDDPRSLLWSTNRLAQFAATPLLGQTQATCLLPHVTTNDTDYYSVAVSNALGATVCAPALVRVDPAVASIAADEAWSQRHCLNNLRQLALFAQLWSQDHAGALPDEWKQMTNAYGLPIFGWPMALFCRSDPARTVPPDWAGVDLSDTSYELASGNPSDPYELFCRCKTHGFYAQMDGVVVSAPQFDAIGLLGLQPVQLNLRLFAGRTNILEATSDFVTWTNLAVYHSTHGPAVFSDTNRMHQRFYRLRLR